MEMLHCFEDIQQFYIATIKSFLEFTRCTLITNDCNILYYYCFELTVQTITSLKSKMCFRVSPLAVPLTSATNYLNLDLDLLHNSTMVGT